MKTPTQTLAAALRILANDIESPDGVANAAIAEAAERLDELTAQVEVLKAALDPFATTGLPTCILREDYSVMHERVKDWFGVINFKNAAEAFNATPAQHLRDIQAEAGRAGFLEGVRQMAENEIGWFGHDADSCANQYAERIRQGGVL